jgi:hypothetical protein
MRTISQWNNLSAAAYFLPPQHGGRIVSIAHTSVPEFISRVFDLLAVIFERVSSCFFSSDAAED